MIQLADGTAAVAGQSYSLEEIQGLKFETKPNGFGDSSFSFTVIDSGNAVLTETLNIKVIGVNDAPELTGTPTALANGSEDVAYTINATDLLSGFTDPDGDTLSVTGLQAANGVLTDNEDGTYTFEPSLNFNGVVSLNYYVDDNNGIKIFHTTSFTLNAVNDAPVQAATVNALKPGTEDNSYVFTSEQLLRSFSDVDGDSLSVTSVTATNGTVTD